MSGRDEDWVTLAHHVTVVDAELQRAHLDAAGIEARIVGAPMASMLPMHATAVELRVTVRRQDLAEARAIVGEADDEDDEDDEHEVPAAKKRGRDPVVVATVDPSDEGDASMRRAAAGAVFGFLVCPPLAMYAIWLLLGHGFGPMGVKGRRLRVVAVAFSTLAVLIWGYLLFRGAIL